MFLFCSIIYLGDIMTDLTIKVLDKLDDIINELDNSDLIKDLVKYKELSLHDKELSKLMDNYKKESDNPYSNSFKEAKTSLYKNENFYNYNHLEGELRFLVLNINSRLNKLVPKKSCVR